MQTNNIWWSVDDYFSLTTRLQDTSGCVHYQPNKTTTTLPQSNVGKTILIMNNKWGLHPHKLTQGNIPTKNNSEKSPHS